jgi:hypothetical protein
VTTGSGSGTGIIGAAGSIGASGGEATVGSTVPSILCMLEMRASISFLHKSIAAFPPIKAESSRCSNSFSADHSTHLHWCSFILSIKTDGDTSSPITAPYDPWAFKIQCKMKCD